jgi:ribosomal protein S12 methylthiotransferase accessory factor YcaO
MTTETLIPGKDASLETTIATMQAKLQACGFHLEEKSWLNPVDGIWSVHVRDRDCPILFTNGKGATRLACLASALGEFLNACPPTTSGRTFTWGLMWPSANMCTTRKKNGLSRLPMANGPRVC